MCDTFVARADVFDGTAMNGFGRAECTEREREERERESCVSPSSERGLATERFNVHPLTARKNRGPPNRKTNAIRTTTHILDTTTLFSFDSRARLPNYSLTPSSALHCTLHTQTSRHGDLRWMCFVSVDFWFGSVETKRN